MRTIDVNSEASIQVHHAGKDQAAKAEYIAHETSGDERAVWRKRAVDVSPDYAKYKTKTDRQIRVFVLEPVA